jgi:hypothetical protein
MNHHFPPFFPFLPFITTFFNIALFFLEFLRFFGAGCFLVAYLALGLDFLAADFLETLP